MDVQSSDHEQLLYNDLPPVLIAADSALARERAQRTVLASGYRSPEALYVDEAPAASSSRSRRPRSGSSSTASSAIRSTASSTR